MEEKKTLLLTILTAVYFATGLVDTACSSNCLNSTDDFTALACNETGECLFGCVDGYTGSDCQVQCSENCINCSLVSDGTGNETICNQCDQNYYLTASTCEPCSKNCYTDSSSSGRICRHENGRCEFGCIKDFYGDNCNQNCFSCFKNWTSGLSSCQQDNGKCQYGCINGYFGDQCQYTCSATCLWNDTLNATVCRQSDGFCVQGCAEGWFGGKCNETCSAGCMVGNASVNASCSQDNGYCDFGCFYNHYGVTCTEVCSQHCQISNISTRTCNETTGNCAFSCVNGYYGSKCDKECSTGCAPRNMLHNQNNTFDLPLCSPIDGSCSFGCNNDSYFANCSGICSPHCLQNSTTVIRACNESNGYCEFGCIDEYYGLSCDNSCSEHCVENSTSDLPICDQLDGTCNFGCYETYYGLKCDKECKNINGDKCLNHRCTREGICEGCRFSWLSGPTCEDDCPVGCKGTGSLQHCHQNGTCIGGCDINYWGPACRHCSVNCNNSTETGTSKCSDINGYCTFGCTTGSYSPTCSERCSDECKNKICNRTNGECLDKCNRGYHGTYCNNTCSINCPDNDCFQENGTCVAETCLVSKHGAWYGPTCKQKCPENCFDKICDKDTGNCSQGCIGGFFGEKCLYACLGGTYGKNCVHNCSLGCVNGTCEPDNGHCVCVTSYIGAACDDKEATPGPTPSKHFPEISGAVGGVALVILIIGVVLLIVWRNKKKKEIVRRRKPKNRQALSEIIRKTVFKSIGGPKRILVDNLLPRVKEMSPEVFESDFNDIEAIKVVKADSEAKKAENLSKNCYINVYPYDENRVMLRSLQLQGDCGKEMKARYRKTMDIIMELTEMAGPDQDYINASFIEGYASSKQRYIASQGPIAATTNDFWKMVFQEKVSVIVMLSETEERGLFKKYWPDAGSQNTYGEITVFCEKQEVYADFNIRRLNIKYLDETRPVQHLQFTSWPSDGPPASSAEMIEFYHKFLSIEPEEDTPSIVHCTSGVGRTGCFIALDLAVDEGNEDHSVDVSQCVTRLREQRVNMVQSEEQYVFVYKTIAQVLSIRTYPVDKERFKREWKELKKDDGKVFQKVYEDLCASVALDELDVESIVKNQAEEVKNREGSDIPEDRYRPKLKNGNYINAVYIDTYKKKNGMIVTQMPTPETINEFFSLLLQEECHVVVMMNEENWVDKTQVKYWPSLDKATPFGDIFVETTDVLDKNNYLLIKLCLSDLTKDGDNKFTVQLYVCTMWKLENTCPKTEVSCLSLVREVLQETGESYTGRILVHCLKGSQRSGLFCAIYILLEKLNYEEKMSVVNTVRKIKSRRANAIPNLDQFRFTYECLVYYIENFVAEIKFKPDEKVQKRSVASNALKRISQMYSKPDKKKKRSDLYAKPDKKKNLKKDDKNNLVTVECEASGSGARAEYAVVDKKGKKKGEKPVYALVNKKGKGKKKSKEVKVTIEQNDNSNDVNDVTDVSISFDTNVAQTESNPYEMVKETNSCDNGKNLVE